MIPNDELALHARHRVFHRVEAPRRFDCCAPAHVAHPSQSCLFAAQEGAEPMPDMSTRAGSASRPNRRVCLKVGGYSDVLLSPLGFKFSQNALHCSGNHCARCWRLRPETSPSWRPEICDCGASDDTKKDEYLELPSLKVRLTSLMRTSLDTGSIPSALYRIVMRRGMLRFQPIDGHHLGCQIAYAARASTHLVCRWSFCEADRGPIRGDHNMRAPRCAGNAQQAAHAQGGAARLARRCRSRENAAPARSCARSSSVEERCRKNGTLRCAAFRIPKPA